MNTANQNGFVLVVALLMLVAVTGIAVSLMAASASDIKMTSVAQQSDDAKQVALGAMEQAFELNVKRRADLRHGGKGNYFTETGTAQFPQAFQVDASNTQVEVMHETPLASITECPHSYFASSSDQIGCNFLRVQVETRYGPENRHQVRLNAGVVQEVKN